MSNEQTNSPDAPETSDTTQTPDTGKAKADTIRALNDRFRQALPEPTDVPGRVMLTSGIRALINTEDEPNVGLPSLFEAIRSFDDFSEDNDPYGEHDFGALDFQGSKIFWKLDYYAPGMLQGSEDPADIEKTVRVLTVMLAEEY